jgi:hypothetical protein
MCLETHAFPDAPFNLSHIATTSYRYTLTLFNQGGMGFQ